MATERTALFPGFRFAGLLPVSQFKPTRARLESPRSEALRVEVHSAKAEEEADSQTQNSPLPVPPPARLPRLPEREKQLPRVAFLQTPCCC